LSFDALFSGALQALLYRYLGKTELDNRGVKKKEIQNEAS
jgi:hypothetical protein